MCSALPLQAPSLEGEFLLRCVSGLHWFKHSIECALIESQVLFFGLVAHVQVLSRNVFFGGKMVRGNCNPGSLSGGLPLRKF